MVRPRTPPLSLVKASMESQRAHTQRSEQKEPVVRISPQRQVYPGETKSKVGRAMWRTLIVMKTLPALLVVISILTGSCSRAVSETLKK